MPNSGYREKAKEIALALQNRLLREDAGYHRIWNAWFCEDSEETVKRCCENGVTVLGFCTDVVPVCSCSSEEVLDTAICAESPQLGRFWCYSSVAAIEELKTGCGLYMAGFCVQADVGEDCENVLDLEGALNK